jgi:hypothetical protein
MNPSSSQTAVACGNHSTARKSSMSQKTVATACQQRELSEISWAEDFIMLPLHGLPFLSRVVAIKT